MPPLPLHRRKQQNKVLFEGKKNCPWTYRRPAQALKHGSSMSSRGGWGGDLPFG